MEKIKARCSFVISYSEDKSFVVADLINLTTGKRFKAKGVNSLPYFCSSDLEFFVSGDWTKYKGTDVFNVETFKPLLYESEESFLGYLKTCFHGIGPKKAKKVLKALDGDYKRFATVAEDKEWLQKNLGSSLGNNIYQQYCEKKEKNEFEILLTAGGLSIQKCKKIEANFESPTEAFKEIKTNPYLLYQDFNLPWITTDKIALMLLPENPQILKSYERIKTATHYVLKSKIAFQGDTYTEPEDLTKKVLYVLNHNKMPEQTIEKTEVLKALNKMTVEKEIVCGKIENKFAVYDSFYFDAENFISKRIAEIVSFRKIKTSAEKVQQVISSLEKTEGISLSLKQKDAVISVLNNNFSVITGGAGTGKTTVLNFCIKANEALNPNSKITLAAPTGRAATRMAASTGLQAGTIHSLLGITEETDMSILETPQQIDSNLLFVDEASMVDMDLFYRLLYNTNIGCKVILIGDPNQLPPVGAGEVLKSIINSDVVPVTRLNVVHRQLEESQIVYNANKILCGQSDLVTGKDFVFFPFNEALQIKEAVLNLFQSELDRIQDITEVQVITPLREKGILSSTSLNKEIQNLVNAEKMIETSSGEQRKQYYFAALNEIKIRKGDKVICQKNTKEAKNGDIGVMKNIIKNPESNKLEYYIQFEKANTQIFSAEQLREMNLTLGYAITVHKSQGSEFKSVILPIAEENRVMLKRNLFYTAVTRAKDKFFLVGEYKEAKFAIKNNVERQRKTCLPTALLQKIS